jgi:hypothetical protein
MTMPGGGCCAARICCPPIKQQAVVAEMLRAWGAESGDPAGKMAEGLLAEFDLVPKGWWSQLVEALRPLFAEAAKQ